MKHLRFRMTLSGEGARRRRTAQRQPAAKAGWLLVGLAVLYLLAGGGLGRVAILSPVSGVTTLDAQIAVSGRTTDTGVDTVTLSINGSPSTLPAPGGLFEAQVPLTPGENIISASANGISSDPVTIVRKLRPVVRIDSPAGSTVSTGSQIEVNGIVDNSDDRAVTVDTNGNTQAVGVMNGRFSATVDLAVGLNVIRVLATDAIPAVVEVSRLEAGIAITNPPDGFTTQQDAVIVEGTLANSPAATITLKLNESRQAVAVRNGVFASNVTLGIGENRIQASLGDKFSNEIVVTRKLPPVVITLISPQSGSTQSPVSEVRGTIQNPRGDSVAVSVNGSERAAPVRAGGFETRVPLELGTNVIRVKQGDAVSNEVLVNRESPPVLIQITSPRSGSTQSSSATVTGTIANARARTVTLANNGSAQTVDIVTGRFSAEVKLVIGLNRIRASQGEFLSNEVAVNRELQPVIIQITSPGSGSTQSSSATVTGTIANARARTVTLANNGSAQTVDIVNGRFSAEVKLAIGLNRIRASQGEFLSNEVAVNRELQPVIIQITSPRSGSTQSSSATVTGTIANSRGRSITLTVNDSPQSVEIRNGGVFSREVKLDLGANRIRASQGDAVSNEVTLRRERPSVSIQITSPRSGPTRDSAVTVTGKVENAPGDTITLTVNRVASRVRVVDGGFTQEVRLVPGENLIRASAGDAADQVMLVRADVPPRNPRIIIDSPKNGETVVRRLVDVTGRVENVGTQTVALTVNGRPFDVRMGTGTFQSRVTLSPGRNLIRANAGNISDEVTVTLRVQQTPPDKPPDQQPDPCAKINCDCRNVRTTLTMAQTKAAVAEADTSISSSLFASAVQRKPERQPRDRQALCRAAEENLRRVCRATGKVSGVCPSDASGPGAWPKARSRKQEARVSLLRKSLVNDKKGAIKP
ncbi:MAG TPA: hypothetical protein VLM38_12365 [Blastocatellia bacterium]|nr:hypothetical protein [Blastocatellia bacterium]